MKTATPKRKAHDTALEGDAQLLQNLLLGVNAHINYDFVLTLATDLRPERENFSDDRLAEGYGDHCHVNAIIAQTIDRVENQVIEVIDPKMDIFDKLLGRMDEWMISNLITNRRDEVWEQALQMITLEGSAQRERMRKGSRGVDLGAG